METFLQPAPEKRGVNKIFIVGAMIAAAAIGVTIWALSFRPSMEDQKAQILEGSYREGTPEFAALTKDIVISTSNDTVQSPNAFGSISMYIRGRIRNKGTKLIDALEVNCAVVTQTNEVLKEKRVLVVPTQQPVLEPEQTIPISLTLDGFSKNDDRANIRWKVTAIRTQN